MNIEDPGDLLRRHGLRSTPQRRAILQAFRGTADEHLSAEEVLSRASGRVPDIGRGTVYATLAELTELEILSAVGIPEPVRFETNLRRHDHFHCRLCLRLFDVDLEGDMLEERQLPGFTIESVVVRADGVCRECDDYRRGLIDGSERVLRLPTMADELIERVASGVLTTPVGTLAVAATPRGIVHVAFGDHADFADLADRARTRRGPAEARARLRDACASLERYFEGSGDSPGDAVDWQLSDEEASDILGGLSVIGYGESLSYDRLGAGLGAYELGVCLGTNPVPLFTPCHRVSRGLQPVEWWVGGAPNLHILHELERAA